MLQEKINIANGQDRLNYLDRRDLPDLWVEVEREEAQVRHEAGQPLLVQYMEPWTTPSGGSGTDIGWCYAAGADVRTTRTWNVRANPDVRVIFGGGRGLYTFFRPAE